MTMTSGAGTVVWDLRLYDFDGNQITGADYGSDFSNSNHIRHAEERTWTINLNSFDQLDFMVYLDDPMAALIRRASTVVKLFRTVSDTTNSKFLPLNETEDPCFAGVVTMTTKSGAENTMRVTCMSALWRLQTHFHLLNHYLETNPDTGQIYTQSELMWKLIDLVNGSFGGDSRTGIIKGTFGWGIPDEPQIGPYFVGKGTNTWANIFDDIMNRPAGPDIIPQYIHEDGFLKQMKFSTDQKRGSDLSATMKFNYHTDPATLVPNCDDMVEEDQIIPGSFGNYLWAVGSTNRANGPNSGVFAVRDNISSVAGSDGYGEIGVYMVRVDHQEVKRVAAIGPIADAEFLKRKHPIPTYSIIVSPVSGIYYDIDFTLGDVVALNADRGAMQLSAFKQRIYQATINMSPNNIEQVDLLVSHDFYGKVEDT